MWITASRILLVAVALAGAGCSGVESTDPPAPAGSRPSKATLEREATRLQSDATNFSDFDLFYLGKSFGGLALSAAEDQGAATEGSYLFVYGECEVDQDPDHPSCTPPVQLQEYSIKRYPLVADPGHALYVEEPDASISRGAVIFTVGGSWGTTVYTSDVAVKINVGASAGPRAVAALRSVRQAGGRLGRLPRPRFAPATLRTLAQVVSLKRRLGDDRAVAARLGWSRRAVTGQLELARAATALGIRLPR